MPYNKMATVTVIADGDSNDDDDGACRLTNSLYPKKYFILNLQHVYKKFEYKTNLIEILAMDNGGRWNGRI